MRPIVLFYSPIYLRNLFKKQQQKIRVKLISAITETMWNPNYTILMK